MPFEVKTLSVLEGRIFEVEERLEAVAALLIREQAVEPRVYRVGEVRRAVRTEGYVVDEGHLVLRLDAKAGEGLASARIVDEELAGVAPRDEKLPLWIHLRTCGGRAPILAGLQEYLGLRPPAHRRCPGRPCRPWCCRQRTLRFRAGRPRPPGTPRFPGARNARLRKPPVCSPACSPW